MKETHSNLRAPTPALAITFVLAVTASLGASGCGKGDSPKFNSEPGSAGTDCETSFALPASTPLSKAEWLDGQTGSYVLESLKAFTKMDGVSQTSEMIVGTREAVSTPNLNPGAPAIECAYDRIDGQHDISLSGAAAMPLEISRRDGTTGQYLRISMTHSKLRPANDTVDSVTSVLASPPPAIFTKFVDGLDPAVTIHAYRADANHILVLATISSTDSDGSRRTLKISGNYRISTPALPEPVPTATVTPGAGGAPGVTSTPTPTGPSTWPGLPSSPGLPGPMPSPSATPLPVPAPLPVAPPHAANARCGANGNAVTIDEHSAFYFSDDSRRLEMLTKLVASGFCAGPNRLGANGDAVTLDGASAFYFSSDEERLNQLVRLYQAGLGSDAYGRCGANGNAITFDGHSAFYISDARTKVDKLISMANAGVCTR